MQSPSFLVTRDEVFNEKGRLDPWRWAWIDGSAPDDATPATARQALAVAAGSGRMRRIPVGVIGPREATPQQIATAEAIGAALGQLGLTVICGGKTGVMEAVSKGCLTAGGLTVGLLPDHDWRAANEFIALPIATGLSEARNMIIAKSGAGLLALGGLYGTWTEIAYGLHFCKPVIGLEGAHQIDGLENARDAEEAVDRLAAHLMTSAGM